MISVAPPGTLGRVSGIAAALRAAFSSVVPTFWGSIFARGVQKQYLRGHLVFVVMLGHALAYNVFVRRSSRILRDAQQVK